MLAALLACGCSSDANNNNNTPATFEEACAQVPGCQTPENAVDGPSVAIWQVMLQRDASGAASVGEVREVDVPSGTGVPQGPLWGAYRLVAYDAAGKVLDAQAIRFPERLVVETVDGTSEETDFTNKASSALGYLEVDASVAKIAITDATTYHAWRRSTRDTRSAYVERMVGQKKGVATRKRMRNEMLAAMFEVLSDTERPPTLVERLRLRFKAMTKFGTFRQRGPDLPFFALYVPVKLTRKYRRLARRFRS